MNRVERDRFAAGEPAGRRGGAGNTSLLGWHLLGLNRRTTARGGEWLRIAGFVLGGLAFAVVAWALIVALLFLFDLTIHLNREVKRDAREATFEIHASSR